jgi:acetyl-CoA carboxylase beta subunit
LEDIQGPDDDIEMLEPEELPPSSAKYQKKKKRASTTSDHFGKCDVCRKVEALCYFMAGFTKCIKCTMSKKACVYAKKSAADLMDKNLAIQFGDEDASLEEIAAEVQRYEDKKAQLAAQAAKGKKSAASKISALARRATRHRGHKVNLYSFIAENQNDPALKVSYHLF